MGSCMFRLGTSRRADRLWPSRAGRTRRRQDRGCADEAEAALAAITEARAQADVEYRHTVSSDLVEAQRKAAGLGEDLIISASFEARKC
jgi:hypothetical protein